MVRSPVTVTGAISRPPTSCPPRASRLRCSCGSLPSPDPEAAPILLEMSTALLPDCKFESENPRQHQLTKGSATPMRAILTSSATTSPFSSSKMPSNSPISFTPSSRPLTGRSRKQPLHMTRHGTSFPLSPLVCTPCSGPWQAMVFPGLFVTWTASVFTPFAS